MSEQQPQKQTPDQLDQDLHEEQGPQYEIVEEEPQTHVGAPLNHGSESSTPTWATAQRVESDPADFTRAVTSSYEAIGDFGPGASEEPAEPSAVDSTDKGLGKSGRQAQTSELKPEEDVDTAREEVKKSLESEEEATEEPTAQQRSAASAKISETAAAAAHSVKRRARQDRSNRSKDASRVAVDKARADGEARRAAKAAKETEAPQTPPIMGERDGAKEKPAKQTVVSEGTDGQQYATEPTTVRPKQARVPKEAATEARQVPEAVIPTQEQPEPAAPTRKPLEGVVISPEVTSQDRYDAELKAMADATGYDPAASVPETITFVAKEEPKAEEPTTTTRVEEIDDDVLAAMGGADSGRPAKRGRNKARRAETTEEATATPVEPVAEPEAPRRPSPADMPGAQGRRKPTPADMPRRRPVTEEVPAAPTPEAAKAETSVAPEADALKTERFEAKTNENVTIAGISTEAAYRKDPVGYFGEDYKDIVGTNNEDTLLINAERKLAGVFDGAGGGGGVDAGLKASRKAAEAVNATWEAEEATVRSKEDALDVMKLAFAEARKQITDDPENDGYTTGIVGKIMQFEGKDYLIYGNAGDSRMVIYNPDTQEITQTEDQGVGSHLFNSIGNDGEGHSMPDTYDAIELPKNARIAFLSDGITGDRKEELLSKEDIRKIFQDNEGATQEELAQAFVAASKKTDDKTVVIMDFHAKEAENKSQEEKPSDDDVLAELDFETPDFAEDVLATAGNRDTRTPEEVEADDAAAEAAKAAADADKTYDPSAIRGNLNLGGFGDRTRSLGAAALGEDADTSWADSFVEGLDDLEESPETSSRPSPFDVFDTTPLADPFSVIRSGEAAAARADTDNDNHDDDEPGAGSLADDLLGDFGDPEPTRRTRRERVGAAFRTGWDKARTYFTGRDIDSSAPDRDRRIAGRQLKVIAGAVGATVLAGALFSGLAGDTGNEGPTHVGKGPSASAEKTPGAKVDSGKTETKPDVKPSESATDSDKKESKKPSTTVDDDHRNEHGAGAATGNKARTIHAGNEDLKISADGSEVTITLDRGGTVWDGLDHAERELHLNSSDTSTAESVQSMKLKPGQDRQMKAGSSYTFKVQGGKLVAKK